MFTLFACICFGLFPGIALGDCSLTDYALEFPNKGVTDFVHIWGMRSLKQFTVCFWMKSNDSSDGTPFSYAVPGSNNELLIAKYNNFAVWIGDEKRQLSVSANDNEWHHICVSWENTAGSMNFFKDGVLSANATNFKVAHVIRSGGSLMLGQEQDSVGGGLSSAQSFQGFLSNLNVWDYVLCQEIITRMSKACKFSEKGNVYAWSSFKLGFEGDPRLFIPSPCAPPTSSPNQENIDDCSSNPCLNNATCSDLANRYNCTCAPGFNGTHCETEINECESNPCLNNGTCTDRVNGFNCSCPQEFTGDRCEGGFWKNSTIIGDNAFYQSTLHAYLKPAVGNNPRWLLCWRGSLHGWRARTFHTRCDGKRNTVTIIKVGQNVFGGYVDIPFQPFDAWGTSPNASLFSLHNQQEGLGPFKSTVKHPSGVILSQSNDGPIFGNPYDIYIADNANTNSRSYSGFGNFNTNYNVPSGVQNSKTIFAGTTSFTPSEIEMFYLG